MNINQKIQFDNDTVSLFLFMNALMKHSNEDRSKLSWVYLKETRLLLPCLYIDAHEVANK